MPQARVWPQIFVAGLLSQGAPAEEPGMMSLNNQALRAQHFRLNLRAVFVLA